MLVPMNYVELRRGTSLQQNCCDILIHTAFYARLLFLDRKRSPAKQVLGRASVLTQEKLLKKKNRPPFNIHDGLLSPRILMTACAAAK